MHVATLVQILQSLALAHQYHIDLQAVKTGQLENTETRERKREGTPKTEVNIFDRAAYNKAIVFSSSQAPREWLHDQVVVAALARQIDA